MESQAAPGNGNLFPLSHLEFWISAHFSWSVQKRVSPLCCIERTTSMERSLDAHHLQCRPQVDVEL